MSVPDSRLLDLLTASVAVNGIMFKYYADNQPVDRAALSAWLTALADDLRPDEQDGSYTKLR